MYGLLRKHILAAISKTLLLGCSAVCVGSIQAQDATQDMSQDRTEIYAEAKAYLTQCNRPSKGLIYISKQTMTLTLIDANDSLQGIYPIACGLNYGNKVKSGDMRTPEGEFLVEQIQNASYWKHDFKDGKGIIAGAYGPWFIRLKTGFNGIGIHGTHAPQSIGTRATEGCIRMCNDDLQQLKPLVEIGMTVVIVPSSNDSIANR